MKCSNEECDNDKLFARGYCQPCYNRLRRNGSVQRKNVVNRGSCSVEGCDRDAFSKNLCAKHYQQRRLADNPMFNIWRSLRSRAPGAYPPEWDDIDVFLQQIGERPTDKHQLRRPDPEIPWSIDNLVWREPILIDRSTAEGRAEYNWVWHIRNRYKLAPADIVAMGEDQGNRCAICRDVLGMAHPDTGKLVRVCIDHDHITKAVRGLLCDPCNKGLGQFRDDADVTQNATDYLLRHKGEAL